MPLNRVRRAVGLSRYCCGILSGSISLSACVSVTVLQCMRRVEELYALPADPELKAKGMAETLLVMRKKIFQ